MWRSLRLSLPPDGPRPSIPAVNSEPVNSELRSPIEGTIAELTRWINIPSVSGSEEAYARAAALALAELGFEVRLHEVAPGRLNVIARRGAARLLFSTHLDTVPPFIPARRGDDRLLGRGACDAKGVFACMLEAARRLIAEHHDDLAFLLLVGEEVDHAGARYAQSQAGSLDLAPEVVLLGEPTELKLMRAQKGILKLRLQAAGRAAHSGYPEQGESAIEKLLDAMARLRTMPPAHDPLLGREHLNIGVIRGGLAANVVAPAAEADLLYRTVGPGGELLARVRAALGHDVALEVGCQTDPFTMHMLPGYPTAVAGFATDAPFLATFGPVILAGPGSILDAHTAEEYITFEQLAGGIELYTDLGRRVLTGAAPLRAS